MYLVPKKVHVCQWLGCSAVADCNVFTDEGKMDGEYCRTHGWKRMKELEGQDDVQGTVPGL